LLPDLLSLQKRQYVVKRHWCHRVLLLGHGILVHPGNFLDFGLGMRLALQRFFNGFGDFLLAAGKT
jgi:hypothetical protein